MEKIFYTHRLIGRWMVRSVLVFDVIYAILKARGAGDPEGPTILQFWSLSVLLIALIHFLFLPHKPITE